jgi:ribosome-associated protein
VPIVVNDRLIIPDDEVEWRFTPSGGPGGQHANRANTRVELTWNVAESAAPTERQRARLQARLGDVVTVVVDDHRSQYRNRVEAAQRLAQRCRAALAPPPKRRRPTKPTAGAKRRRLDAKRRQSQTKKLRQRPRHDD